MFLMSPGIMTFRWGWIKMVEGRRGVMHDVYG